MKLSFALFCLLFVSSYTAFEFFTIDSFASSQTPLVLIVPAAPAGTWYSPGDGATFAIHTTDDCISGERDIVLGYRTITPEDSVSIISIVGRQLSVAFPLDYVGGAYVQWDGADGLDTVSLTEGIGSGIPIPETVEGRLIDFTSFGRSSSFGITVTSDLPVTYNIDMYDELSAGSGANTLTFINLPPTEESETRYVFNFDDARWTRLATFDWTRVLAMQIRIVTAEGGADQAIDTAFYQFGVIGYRVEANVFIDCGCDDIPDSFIFGETFTLVNTANPSVILETTTSDINGDFEFTGYPQGTYMICFEDTTVDNCIPANGCRTFVFQNEEDVGVLTFGVAQVTSLTVSDVTIECDDCDTVDCLGGAIASQCGTANTIEITDNVESSITTLPNCDQQFTRTYTDQGITVTQTITIVDNDAPILETPASSITRQCDDNTAISFTAWIAANGNAVWSDCNSMTFSNDNTGSLDCGSVSVTFIASDRCGNQTPTTASYTILDNSAPTFTVAPTDDGAPCDENGGSDFTTFNQWLASNGRSTINDNCSSFTVTNNYVDDTLVRGCLESVAVTFTATDSCSNSDSRVATFTISDAQGPSIFPQAQPQTVECNDQSITSFNTWRADNAGARASDDCGSAGVTFTDNFTGSAPFGCDSSVEVIFTATDACGQIETTAATFRVVDGAGPVLTTAASPFSSDCASQGNDLTNWLADAGGARANDICNGAVAFTDNFSTIEDIDCTSTPVTFEACDSCGNCVSTTASFSVVDTEAPTFSQSPVDQSLVCGSDSQAAYESFVNSAGGASVFDNCSSANEITITNNAPTLAPVFNGQCTASVDVAFIARDPCGNTSAPAIATFSIIDQDAPAITVFPLDETVDCGSDVNTLYQSWRSTSAGAQAVDACSTAFFSNNGPSTVNLATGSCIEVTNVIFTATDSCGNQTPVSASFTIVDNSAPVMGSPAVDESAECNQSSVDAWLARNGGMTASDACSGVTFTNNFNGFTGGCIETAFVTFTATDACGFAIDSSATFSVSDSVSPTINPQATSLNVPCDNDTGIELSTWLNDNGGARATDSCQDDADLIWSNNFSTSVVGCDFATVTFTVTDACGNSRDTTATFTSVDNDAPTFSPAAQDLTVECNGSGNTQDFASFVANRGGSVPVDQCALSFTFTDNAPATGPASCGSMVVNFTVEDECGNSATTSARYTVEDSFAPTFSNLPSSQTVDCDGTGNTQARNDWVSSNGGATAFDACASTVNFSQTRIDTTGDACAATDVYQFTASDACGNSDFVTASFTVRDLVAPVFTVEPTAASYECDGNGNLGQINTWVNDNGGARATDACQGSVVFTDDFNGTGLFTCVSTTVTFTAADGCGNISSRSSTVSVVDSVIPAFTFFPADITVPCDADVTTDVLGFAVATDNCAGELFVVMSEVSFDEPADGDCPGDHIITRTFSAFDDCANSVTRDQVITVNIARASGPCDPVGCECDDCCPPAAASDCLAVDCQASACRSVPCSASTCTCDVSFKKSANVARQVEELPQCKPVYIYVNDDDDTPHSFEDGVVTPPRMLVTNEALHL